MNFIGWFLRFEEAFKPKNYISEVREPTEMSRRVFG